MAVNDPNYRYATQTWEADGVRTQYEIAFDGGYIRQSDVVAFSVLVDEDTGLTSDRQIHPVVFLDEEVDSETGWKTATVEITPAVAEGRRVVIFRSTQKSAPMVKYQAGSVLTRANLDLANQQAILAIAEIMDGLNTAQITLDQQIQEVIDMNTLIQNVYEQVIELLASGGIVSVNPRVWAGTGNAEDTDFPIVGADVDAPGFYDTYVDGIGLEPGVDYTIIVGETPADTLLRFTVPPGDGIHWFTVLRGFARPYTGPTPVTTLRANIISVPGTSYIAGFESEFALLSCTNDSAVTVEVKEIPAVGDPATKMGNGSYFSATQRGAGQVEFVPETVNVSLVIPAGCVAKTRGEGCTITATCESADANVWIISGDLAIEEP